MKNTLTTLSPLICKNLTSATYSNLAQAYQQSLDPRILASCFYKCYAFIIKISNQFFNLPSEDAASYALELLDYSLRTYDPEKANFLTYFGKMLHLRFVKETRAATMQKRSLNYRAFSYEAAVEAGHDLAYFEDSVFELMDDLKSRNLTEVELEFCALRLENCSSAEVAKKLGCSAMTLTNIKRRLQIKLADMV